MMYTEAPASAKRIAVAAPMPYVCIQLSVHNIRELYQFTCVPPATTATFPARSRPEFSRAATEDMLFEKQQCLAE